MAKPFQFRLRSLFYLTAVAAVFSFVGPSAWARLRPILFPDPPLPPTPSLKAVVDRDFLLEDPAPIDGAVRDCGFYLGPIGDADPVDPVSAR
jgi:hypothetical protein